MLVSAVLPTLATLLSFIAPSLVVSAGTVPVVAPSKRAFGFSAPHYSLYLNDEMSYDSWPGPDKIQPYNRVLLAFWLTTETQAAPTSWVGFTDAQRQAILTSYHDAGIALMVSAFGDDDKVVTAKKDPVATAQSLAAFVKQYSFDGVDIDFEDFTPLQTDQAYALDWLTKFHTELRAQLPADSYAISSTPTAWMYGSVFGSESSVYCQLNKAVGSSISWYQMQLYNGNPGTWDTCENTMWKSADPAFLSVNEIATMCDIPLSKISIGKLWDKSDLAKDGIEAEIPSPADFGQCIVQSKAQISYPDTGIMVWAAHLTNWNGAITFLKDTLAAQASSTATAVASSAAASGSASASASGSAAASPAASGASASAAAAAAGSPSVAGASSGSPAASSSGTSSVSAKAGTSAGTGTAANAVASNATSAATRAVPAALGVFAAIAAVAVF